jgi:hypothetical protein
MTTEEKQAQLDKIQERLIVLLSAYELKLAEAIKTLKPAKATFASVACGLKVVEQANQHLRESRGVPRPDASEDEAAPLKALRLMG